MTRMVKIMTERELRAWDAAYAAAFVASFRAKRGNLALSGGYSDEDTFEMAAQCILAADSIAIANLAIVRLREHRRDTDTDAGHALDDRHAHRLEPDPEDA